MDWMYGYNDINISRLDTTGDNVQEGNEETNCREKSVEMLVKLNEQEEEKQEEEEEEEEIIVEKKDECKEEIREGTQRTR